MPLLLIVDDDEVLRDRLARAFVDRGYDVRTADDYDERAGAGARATRPSSRWSTCGCRAERASSWCTTLQGDRRRRPRSWCSPATAASRPRSTRSGSARALPAEARRRRRHPRRVRARRGAAARAAGPIDYKAPSLARAEWEHINRVLSDCGGNISEAARRLGIHRRAAAQAAEVPAGQVRAQSSQSSRSNIQGDGAVQLGRLRVRHVVRSAALLPGVHGAADRERRHLFDHVLVQVARGHEILEHVPRPIGRMRRFASTRAGVCVTMKPIETEWVVVVEARVPLGSARGDETVHVRVRRRSFPEHAHFLVVLVVDRVRGRCA